MKKALLALGMALFALPLAAQCTKSGGSGATTTWTGNCVTTPTCVVISGASANTFWQGANCAAPVTPPPTTCANGTANAGGQCVSCNSGYTLTAGKCVVTPPPPPPPPPTTVPPPVASIGFAGADWTFPAGKALEFTAADTSTDVTFSWAFGDGTSAAGASVEHLYGPNVTTASVTLTASRSGATPATKTYTVAFTGGPTTVAFGNLPVAGTRISYFNPSSSTATSSVTIKSGDGSTLWSANSVVGAGTGAVWSGLASVVPAGTSAVNIVYAIAPGGELDLYAILTNGQIVRPSVFR